MSKELTWRKPTQKEFEDWFEMSCQSFSEDLAFINNSNAEAEYKMIVEKSKQILKNGKDTENHVISVYDTDDDKNIGFTWFGELQGLKADQAFLYEITISENHRSKGCGRQILNMMHKELKNKGYSQVLLNVMKRNYAKNLYISLGYKPFQNREHSMIMLLDL